MEAIEAVYYYCRT